MHQQGSHPRCGWLSCVPGPVRSRTSPGTVFLRSATISPHLSAARLPSAPARPPPVSPCTFLGATPVSYAVGHGPAAFLFSWRLLLTGPSATVSLHTFVGTALTSPAPSATDLLRTVPFSGNPTSPECPLWCRAVPLSAPLQLHLPRPPSSRGRERLPGWTAHPPPAAQCRVIVGAATVGGGTANPAPCYGGAGHTNRRPALRTPPSLRSLALPCRPGTLVFGAATARRDTAMSAPPYGGRGGRRTSDDTQLHRRGPRARPAVHRLTADPGRRDRRTTSRRRGAGVGSIGRVGVGSTGLGGWGRPVGVRQWRGRRAASRRCGAGVGPIGQVEVGSAGRVGVGSTGPGGWGGWAADVGRCRDRRAGIGVPGPTGPAPKSDQPGWWGGSRAGVDRRGAGWVRGG